MQHTLNKQYKSYNNHSSFYVSGTGFAICFQEIHQRSLKRDAKRCESHSIMSDKEPLFL